MTRSVTVPTLAAIAFATAWAISMRYVVQYHSANGVFLLAEGGVAWCSSGLLVGPGWVLHPAELFIGWFPMYGTVGSFSFVYLPLWLPAGIFAAFPAVVLVRRRLRNNRRCAAGCCLRCDYNLTGNVSGVCPECGLKVQMT